LPFETIRRIRSDSDVHAAHCDAYCLMFYIRNIMIHPAWCCILGTLRYTRPDALRAGWSDACRPYECTPGLTPGTKADSMHSGTCLIETTGKPPVTYAIHLVCCCSGGWCEA